MPWTKEPLSSAFWNWSRGCTARPAQSCGTMLMQPTPCRSACSRPGESAARSRRRRALTVWITRILINECHTLRYRLRRHKTVSFDEAVGDVPAGEPVDLGLRDALRAVPEHLRLPLLLHHMEGYSLQEVADMLHISVAAARGRVYQARQKLRQQLDKEEQQP